MRVDTESQYQLEKFIPDRQQDMFEDPDLPNALELLYNILQGSFHAAGAALEHEINGQRETVQSLYWKCKELLEQVGTDFNKTGFLAMSVIEKTYNDARPLILCRMDELLSGECRVPEHARELEAILADNPYKKIWAERAGLYVKILTSIGFKPDAADFTDLTTIMDPLLNALGFYAGRRGSGATVYKVRNGARSDSKDPKIARAVCRYRSEKELVDAAMSCGHDSVILFGAVEKTHAQVADYFEEWFNGYPGERQRNFMRNDGITSEEYLAMGCDYTRKVYTCVKSGGTCWLVPMPYNNSQYGKIGETAHEYCYGKRASYAPYEVFLKEPPIAPEGTTLLAIPMNGCLLSDLMDSLQMAWFPAFMDETIKYFFRCETEPASEPLLFPEEAVADMPGQDPDGSSHAIVPVVSGVPAIPNYRYSLKPPEDMGFEPWFLELTDYFGITVKNLAGLPLLPVGAGDTDSYDGIMDDHVKKAYIRLVAERAADLFEGRWEVRRWLVNTIWKNADSIIEQAGNGDLMSFTTLIIEGWPVLDENGCQKMTTQQRYPYAKKPDTQHVDPSYARMYRSDIYKNMSHMVLWAGEPTSGTPGVVMRLRPYSAEHYAALTGVDEKDLPDILRISGPMTKFRNAYKDVLRGDIMNQWTFNGYGDRKPSACIQCMAPVNICMGKKTLQKMPYFKGIKKPIPKERPQN